MGEAWEGEKRGKERGEGSGRMMTGQFHSLMVIGFLGRSIQTWQESERRGLADSKWMRAEPSLLSVHLFCICF